MTQSYQELFQPYTKDGATLEGTIKWLQKHTAHPEVLAAVIANTFAKLAGGLDLSKELCACGCGMTGVHTALEHFMLKEVKTMEAEFDRAVADVIETHALAREQAAIDRYIAENTVVKSPGIFSRTWTFLNKPLGKTAPATNVPMEGSDE
jgi:hypothetical protein